MIRSRKIVSRLVPLISTTEADKGHKLSLPGCRFHFVASTLSLPSSRFHVVALKIKGGLCCGTLTESIAGLLGSTIAVLYFCIFIFVSPPPFPSCRFQVVASKLSLPGCRFQVVRTCPL